MNLKQISLLLLTITCAMPLAALETKNTLDIKQKLEKKISQLRSEFDSCKDLDDNCLYGKFLSAREDGINQIYNCMGSRNNPNALLNCCEKVAIRTEKTIANNRYHRKVAFGTSDKELNRLEKLERLALHEVKTKVQFIAISAQLRIDKEHDAITKEIESCIPEYQ